MKLHNSPPGSFWSDQSRIDQLIKLWASGWSASRIAAALKAPSRNSIISKVRRMGLPYRGPTSGHKPKIKTESNVPPPKPKAPKMPKPAKPAPIPLPRAEDKARIAPVDLKPEHCRWPTGDPREVGAFDPLFCGLRKMQGSEYCPGHTARSQNVTYKIGSRPVASAPTMESRVLEPEAA